MGTASSATARRGHTGAPGCRSRINAPRTPDAIASRACNQGRMASASPVAARRRRLAAQEIRAQFRCEVRVIIAAPVVVLDPQVVIGNQALRDDEVVRLVAGRQLREDLTGAGDIAD